MVLALASNLLELDIIIIPAFREAAMDPVTGVTTIKPLVCARHQAIHLFQFSESDFISAHYESVFPRTDDDFEVTDMSIPPAFELTDEISNMREEYIRNCQFPMTKESIQVVVTTMLTIPGRSVIYFVFGFIIVIQCAEPGLSIYKSVQ